MYLYLKEKEYVDTWTRGGIVPLFLASNYRKNERTGIFTPDENKQVSIEGKNIQPLTKKIIDSVIHNPGKGKLVINGNILTHDGIMVSENVKYSDAYEDALIICFSTVINKQTALKFEKNYCVEIKNIQKLKQIFDKQLNSIGEIGRCNYTDTDNRNHFLKSHLDAWQQEYRIVWRTIQTNKELRLPKGFAIDKSHMI